MIVEIAPAKINLALHVRARRGDGYHDIETLFAFCRDGDTVVVAPADTDTLTITGPFGAGLEGADNLVLRAAAAFAARFEVGAAHAIVLDKHLPVASGIGGGSADAAATLRALARLHDIDPNDSALVEIAARLGADVPACLLGRTAFGSGRGEKLRVLVPLDGLPVLLVNPGVALSTASVFALWEGIDRGGVDHGDPVAAAMSGRNDLQSPARAIAPEIDDAIALLGAQPGVVLARMSGSGATCFALFDDVDDRDRATAVVAREKPDWWHLATALA